MSDLTPRVMFEWTARGMVRDGLASESTLERGRAESCARVLDMIAGGTLIATDADYRAAIERINHASGTADRTVLSAILETIQGLAFRLERA